MGSNKVKHLVVCGDSFSCGIGCQDLSNEPFGSLLAKQLNLEQYNLAKGSATHLNILLQVEYAMAHLPGQIELMLISNTSYDRIDWWPVHHHHQSRLRLTDVNYHQYPPYKHKSYQVQIDCPVLHDPEYCGKMFTENFVGVIEYWRDWGSKNKKFDYFEKFYDESPDRMRLLHDFALDIHDTSINRMHSMGLLTLAHNRARRAGVRHLILTHELENYAEYIDSENLVHVDWMQLRQDFPDDLPSGHTSKQGHVIVQQAINNKLLQNGWIL